MLNTKSDGFYFDSSAEPHQQRRKRLLEKYPHIKDLIGHERKTKYIAIALVLLQIIFAFYAQSLPWFWWIILVYAVGATIIHEVSHNLAFKKKSANRCFALFINLPLGIPAALGFEKYHLLHHRFMGCKKRDVDIPLLSEAHFFNSRLGKFFWLLIQPFTYTLRPLLKYPQKITAWEWGNNIIQVLFDVLVLIFFGPKVLGFLILSTLLGMSLHPVAMHFIAEHYIAHEEQESYSYYGPFNRITFNVGYHVEHHDFPGIPWSKIKQLKAIAPEYYQPLYAHKSWIGFMIQFISSKHINLFSRKIRAFKEDHTSVVR